MSEELGNFAMQRLIESGIEVILNARVTSATANNVELKDGRSISTNTIICKLIRYQVVIEEVHPID
jgi:NADH dehydrogenase FAD-containing subunit